MSWFKKSIAQNSREDRQQKNTQQIAYELYQRRLQSGQTGDAQSDWETSKKIIRNPVRTILFRSSRPAKQALRLVFIETPKWFLFSMPKLEWTHLLAVPLTIAISGSIISSQFQREAELNQRLKDYFDRLETLTFEQNLLAEKPNPGAIVLARGRTVAALRELDLSRKQQLLGFLHASGLTTITTDENEEKIEPVISFKDQSFSGIDFKNIYLKSIDLQGADLADANLSNAYLIESDLRQTDLSEANLNNAYLWETDFSEANLINANLSNTDLSNTNLSNAYLWETNLSNADLSEANLSNADFSEANLSNTDLSNTNLSNSLLFVTDLRAAKNLTSSQLEGERSPYLCNVALPDNITNIDPNRDCAKFPQLLSDRYSWQSLEEAQKFVDEVRSKKWD